MSKRKRGNDTNVRKAKKKSGGKWFALDNLLGKMLCLLLAVILMVGAFLTPKLLSSLYDARTLMQISYTDMDLKTYEVAYTDFQKKMEAIAREKTAGNKLSVLTTADVESTLSDEELVERVNAEMDAVAKGMDWLLLEGWWSALTTDNLVSRKKNTVYARKQGDAQEMAPFSTWTLVFQVTDKQKEVKVSDGKGGYLIENQFATDRLIVCMDADFYKIYAVAVAGEDAELLMTKYGWPNLRSMMQPVTVYKQKVRTDVDAYYEEMQSLRFYCAGQATTGWTDYWGVVLKDMAYDAEMLFDEADYIGSYLIFRDGTRAASASDHNDTGVVSAKYHNENFYIFEPENRTEDEIYLEVGFETAWDSPEEGGMIFKAGCREFFEMLQF